MTSNISQDVVIVDNDVFTKPYDKGFVKETLTKRIAWSTKEFELQSAKLKITADQPAQSGADLQTSVNGSRVSTIRWEGFDTEEKEVEVDVIARLLNGVNDFSFLFNAPNHVFQAAELQISVVLTLAFRQLTVNSDDDTPASTGGTKDAASFEKFVEWVKDNIKLILVVATITGVTLTILKFWNKMSLPGRLSKFANFIR
jgi:hypothetical protein